MTGPASPVTKPEDGSGGGSSAIVDQQGSAAGSATPEPEKKKEPEPPAAPEPDAFMKLPKEEKIKIMKTKVLPAMAKAFKAFDPKKYAKFTCKSCHGKGATDGKGGEGDYKMPSSDVPALDFAALKAGKQEPKTAEFMGKVVKPEMAKLLGNLEEYDEKHPGGFGCLHCHTMKQ